MRVTSREYKVIVDGSLFADLKTALSDILDDIGDPARSAGLGVTEKFDAKDPNERTILFLDTPDYTLRKNGLLLRQRVKQKSGKTEYTLKCRTEDRYIAAGKDLSPAPGLKHDSKLEEDIGVPFVSRFSHSTTVELDDDDQLAGENFPETLSAAGRLFPVVLTVQHDGLPCPPETAPGTGQWPESFRTRLHRTSAPYSEGTRPSLVYDGHGSIDSLVKGKEGTDPHS
jgi:hypothetical protein